MINTRQQQQSLADQLPYSL